MLNFFDPAYQTPPIADLRFGLCDNENGTAAFVDTTATNMDNWIAIVENKHAIPLVFTAIDKGVVKDDEYPNCGRCDGMLMSDRHLYFVELKNEKESWIQKGVFQLESTIRLFDGAHPGVKKRYVHKKAFLCNRKHPSFHVSNKEQSLKFFRAYGFRLDIQAKVLMV